MMNLKESIRRRVAVFRRNEDAVSLTTEVLVFIPLAMMFLGLLINSAMHFVGVIYVQQVANMGASLTAAAGGDVTLAYIPQGGMKNMKPSEYVKSTLNSFPLIDKSAGNAPVVNCGFDSRADASQANAITRCWVKFRVIWIPTDPLSKAAWRSQLLAVGEDISQTGSNPNVQ